MDDLEFGGELIGEVTITCSATPCTQANATGKPTMFHPDHLGSILALSDGNTAGNGTFTAQSYDSWGARRPVSIFNRSGTPAGTVVSAEHRGYIGEEELDQLGLLNLNRRLYDPRLGRFLAADPITSGFFGDPQQLNRYAYARNQPLSASDPTGFDPNQDGSSYGPGSTQTGGGNDPGASPAPSSASPCCYEPGGSLPIPNDPNTTYMKSLLDQLQDKPYLLSFPPFQRSLCGAFQVVTQNVSNNTPPPTIAHLSSNVGELFLSKYAVTALTMMNPNGTVTQLYGWQGTVSMPSQETCTFLGVSAVSLFFWQFRTCWN